MAFTVRQKVVCIDASPDLWGRKFRAKLGAVYTIDRIGICAPGGPCCGLSFVELGTYDANYMWCSDRFRPVVERKTDISIFTEMLNPESEQV